MKNWMKHALLMAFALCTAATMTACDSDDDDNGGKVPTSGTFTLEYLTAGEMFDLFDITMVYTDESGVEKSEVITLDKCGASSFEDFTYSYKRDVKCSKLPASADFSVNLTLKADYPVKEKYTFYRTQCITWTDNLGKSSIIRGYSSKINGLTQEGLIKLYQSKSESLGAYVDEAGHISMK